MINQWSIRLGIPNANKKRLSTLSRSMGTTATTVLQIVAEAKQSIVARRLRENAEVPATSAVLLRGIVRAFDGREINYQVHTHKHYCC